MKRRRLTALQRTKIFDAHSGKCCLCNQRIDAPKQKWILEHRKPLWLGGADDESNIAPAHQDCAIRKTQGEAPIKAKSDRVRARHIGIRKPRTIRAWRKFDGTPVYAGEER